MGTHFAVLKQLHPNDAADFHMSCLDYITGKVGKYVQQERSNKSKEVKQRLAAKRGQAMVFWKCLSLLLAPINGRDALRLRDQMESWLHARAGSGFDRQTIASSKHKMWDGYKAYEKKLMQIMSKDGNLKAASQRVVQASQAEAARAKGKKRARQEVEEEDDEDDGARERSESLTPTPDDPVPAPATKAKSTGRQGRSKALTRQESRLDMDVDEDGPAQEADANDAEAEAGTEEEGQAEEEEPAEEEEEEDLDLSQLGDGEMDIDLDLELDNDLDFANADFPILTQGSADGRSRAGSRARSVSVEPVMKKKRTTMVL